MYHRTCTRCGESKPLCEFGFSKVRGHGEVGNRPGNAPRETFTRLVLQWRCKSCKVAIAVENQSANRERYRANLRRFHANHPERRSAGQRVYLRRKRSQRCKCCTQDEMDAFYAARPVGMEVDHIVPIAKGGPHCVRNFQYLTPTENRVKGARLGGCSHF